MLPEPPKAACPQSAFSSITAAVPRLVSGVVAGLLPVCAMAGHIKMLDNLVSLVILDTAMNDARDRRHPLICYIVSWNGVLIAGFAAQDKLVQGLSLGAAK